MLALEAQRENVGLTFHCTAWTPQLLVGDKNHLEEVLTNLASNAVKFTERGYVNIAVDAVAWGADTVRLRFEVTDTGIGISPYAQSRIFDRFTQADETIIDRFGGTGLGLAIAKQLVELQGGTIRVLKALPKTEARSGSRLILGSKRRTRRRSVWHRHRSCWSAEMKVSAGP